MNAKAFRIVSVQSGLISMALVATFCAADAQTVRGDTAHPERPASTGPLGLGSDGLPQTSQTTPRSDQPAVTEPDRPNAAGKAVAGHENAPVGCTVVMVPMRDGVKLSTEVYRPLAAGKYPVILQRTPYHGAVDLVGCRTDPRLAALAASGYVVINQEVRGTSRSEGALRPIVNEGNDGYDAVEWAARQPWSTGKVGMMGGSYLGLTQWQAALKRPPHLVTIIPNVAPTGFENGWIHSNGALGQATAQIWSVNAGLDQAARKRKAANVSADHAAALPAEPRKYSSEALLRYDALLRPPADVLPLAGDPVFNSELTPWYAEWLAHPKLDSYWSAANVEDKYQTLSIPVLSLGGFYDVFILGTVAGYTGMHERARTPEARAAARLVVAGPGHSLGMNNYIGDLSFGAENATPEDLSVRWFDYWLKGIDNGVMKEPPVKLYVMLPPDQGSIGGGFWVTGDSYPLPGTKTVRYYLGGKNANTFLGDGVLSLNPSAASGSDCYKYDPANPVPTVGGAWSAGKLLLRGAYDQRPIEMRPDVLVYTSEALTDPVSVVGNISVTLTASSSAPSTAFTAKLVDVHLDGYAQILSNGIIVTPSAAPDTVATYTIQMNPTATIFKPGHRIRLEISSSNYPRYNAHTNTNAPLGTAKNIVVATQTIMWNGTSLNLPVVPISIPATGAP